jgi:hypothetical protein
MSEYAQRFAENRIDLLVLPDFTDQHLKDLGVALGDRLKMLRAIGDITALLRPHRTPQLLSRRSKTLPSAGQVTVTFSDSHEVSEPWPPFAELAPSRTNSKPSEAANRGRASRWLQCRDQNGPAAKSRPGRTR